MGDARDGSTRPVAFFALGYNRARGELQHAKRADPQGGGVLGNRFLITAHRKDQSFLEPILRKYRAEPGPVYLLTVMLEVLLAAVETYRQPLEDAEMQIHAFEAAILTDRRDTAHWDAVFQIQARLTVMKRMLWHTLQAVQRFVPRSDRACRRARTLKWRFGYVFVWIGLFAIAFCALALVPQEALALSAGSRNAGASCAWGAAARDR